MSKKYGKKMKKHTSRKKSQFGDKAVKKHDLVNQSYLNRIKGMDIMYNNLEYRNPAKTYVVGELDGFCYRSTPLGNIAYILETKGTYNPALLTKGRGQLKRAVEKFIPDYERRNNIHFDKIVTLLANPGMIKCQKVYNREPKTRKMSLDRLLKQEQKEFKDDAEVNMNFCADRLKAFPLNQSYHNALHEAYDTSARAIKDFYLTPERPTRKW